MMKRRLKEFPSGDDYAFDLPVFESQAEFDAWYDSLPKVEAEVDPRLKQQVEMTLVLSQRDVEGLEYIARQKGLGFVKNVVKLILNRYLACHLPLDF
jgi:hypothetical protein